MTNQQQQPPIDFDYYNSVWDHWMVTNPEAYELLENPYEDLKEEDRLLTIHGITQGLHPVKSPAPDWLKEKGQSEVHLHHIAILSQMYD